MLGGSTAGIPHQFKEQLERTTRYVYHGRKFASFSLGVVNIYVSQHPFEGIHADTCSNSDP